MTNQSIPQHIAIIMDGNGRWAKKIKKSRTYGHRAGHTAVLKTVKHATKTGVKSLTLYAFSSENWQRPESEVKALLMLFSQAIKRNRKLFFQHDIRFRVIGDKAGFSDKLQREIQELEDETAKNQGLALNIAANYGAKWEIVHATQQLAKKVEAGEIAVDDIDESRFNAQLCLADQAPVDLLIRTGGELRISNYLLWQCAYAEFYFTPIFWPEFNEIALDDAIDEFQKRQRRFGNIDIS